MSHIVYLSNARLPTEKAHGFQVMKMCEAMAQLGHDVELMHPRRRQPNQALALTDPFSYYGVEPTFRIRTLANVDVVPLERWLPEWPLRLVSGAHQLGWGWFAARQASQANPDLIYTRDPALAYWVARRGQACVFEAHVPPTGKQAPLIRSFSRRPSMLAVLPLTSYTASDLEMTGVPSHKLEVLPDAADLTAFAEVPAKDDARRLLDLPVGAPIIGYIGRFAAMGKEKGIPDLIRAFACSELRHLEPLLLCVGGPMEAVPEYLELARSLGIPATAIRFLDRVPNAEVPVWLAALDVATLPYPAADSYVPTTAMSPLKLFEYMAAGLPIVSTDLPAVREVLDDQNAVLVPPGDPAAFGRALSGLLEDADLAAALGRRARHDAAHYTWHSRAERALSSALDGAR